MTILAGAVCRAEGATLDDSIPAALRRLISREPHAILEFADRASFLVKVDLGIFGDPAALQDGAGHVSLLAGEPLLRAGGEESSARSADLQQLHQQWVRSDWSGLSRCTGTFCAIHYSPVERRLSLVSDKLGLRPIYYWAGAGMVVFASALRILEGIDAVPLAMDLRGATEAATFGFSLGERTPYAGISTLGAGQVVNIMPTAVRKTHYWRWDDLPPNDAPVAEVARDAALRFQSAIDRRLRGEKTAVAFLSGGLDSRSIVTLLAQRATVHALNFAWEHTQDRAFAAEMARVLGIRYFQLEANSQSMYFHGRAYNQGHVAKWFDAHPEVGAHRRVLWSGDGGSVGVGHVYLNDEIVCRARSGREDAAIAAYMHSQRCGMHARIFRDQVAATVVQMPQQGIQEELDQLRCRDRGRAFHLFLMLNDQRRHLAKFYENIDLDGLEFHLPFYDADFLEPILRSPIDGFLKHEFYMKWLEHFPPAITSVPWQAYPGHVPCPLSIPEGLSYQWVNPFSAAVQKQLKRELVQQIGGFLESRDFPGNVLDRRMLRLTKWLTQFGIRDYDYLLRQAVVYCRYSAGGGRIST